MSPSFLGPPLPLRKSRRTRFWKSSITVYIAGTKIKARSVEVAIPPSTTHPSGAFSSEPSSSFRIKGIWAMISAAEVIRIGRRRVGPAVKRAVRRSSPCRRRLLV
jgi:hypothetical protein